MTDTRVSTLISIATGVVTWAVVTAVTLYLIARESALLGRQTMVFLGFSLAYLAAMLITTWPDTDKRRGPTKQRIALWVQLLCAFATALAVDISILPIYTIIWIAIAAAFYSSAACAFLLIAIMAAWYTIETFVWGEAALISVLLYGTFHLFALLSSRSAIIAEKARDDVENLNRELLATQHLLSEASRQNERMRIARDLHDLLGHHLTALSINLQIAERVATGDAQEKIAECRALARLLLSDVRDTVSTLRERDPVDFARAVRLLLDNVPELQIDLAIEDELEIDDVEVAESLLRCIQECITNTLRHAQAKRSWIRLWHEGGAVKLQVHDDGTADSRTPEGNGIAGMRERIAKLGGSLELDRIRSALCVRVEIPLAE